MSGGFLLSENLLLIQKLSSQNAKFGAENPHFKKSRDKDKIVSTHKNLCQKFTYVCCKLLPAPPTFLTRDVAGYSRPPILHVLQRNIEKECNLSSVLH